MAWLNPKKKIRQQKLLEFLDEPIGGRTVLELGAFASPTFEPHECNVKYADRLSTAELKSTITDVSKLEAIVDVDYVLDAEGKPEGNVDCEFDIIIANHVFEHLPNPIGWINNISQRLSEGGILFLSIPDKNFTFDIIREPTLLREIIDAWVGGYDRPTVGNIFDAKYMHRDIKNGGQVWSGKWAEIVAKKNNIDKRKLLASILHRYSEGQYQDAHCNVFTEMSFRNIFREIEGLGILDVGFAGTGNVVSPYNEFYTFFRKAGG